MSFFSWVPEDNITERKDGCLCYTDISNVNMLEDNDNEYYGKTKSMHAEKGYFINGSHWCVQRTMYINFRYIFRCTRQQR